MENVRSNTILVEHGGLVDVPAIDGVPQDAATVVGMATFPTGKYRRITRARGSARAGLCNVSDDERNGRRDRQETARPGRRDTARTRANALGGLDPLLG